MFLLIDFSTNYLLVFVGRPSRVKTWLCFICCCEDVCIFIWKKKKKATDKLWLISDLRWLVKITQCLYATALLAFHPVDCSTTHNVISFFYMLQVLKMDFNTTITRSPFVVCISCALFEKSEPNFSLLWLLNKCMWITLTIISVPSVTNLFSWISSC